MQLYLSKRGTKLRIKDGLFEVRYFDQNDRLKKEQYAPAQVESIWLYYATTLSVAVLDVAQKNNVDIVFADQNGFPIGRFHPHKPNSTSLVVKAQSMISHHPHRFIFVYQWLLEKMQAQIAFLTKLRSRRSNSHQQFLDKQINYLKKLAKELLSLKEQRLADPGPKIRGIEGAAGRTFFHALNELLLPRYQFAGRSRRPAQDAFNAFLNYAFALLYAKVERSLVVAGINPYVGFLHRDGYQFKSMVYDFIEPFRMDTIQVVFRLFSREKVTLSRHVTERDGGVFLNKTGKRLLIEALQHYYSTKKVLWQGVKITREDWITKRAQTLARELIGMMEEVKAVK